MKHLLPLAISLNCLIIQVSGVLEWTVIEKVTEYGQNVTLFCHVLNCCPKYAGWDMWTPVQRTLFIDVKTGRPNKKYDGKVMEDGYTLIIQNLTERDLNVSYSCLYDVTFGKQKFLMKEDVFTYISNTRSNESTGTPKKFESQIVGIIVGVAVVVGAVVFVLFYLRRERTKTNISREEMYIDNTDKNKYKRKIASGKEVRHYVRIHVIGKGKVGKTSLVRNLLGKSLVRNLPGQGSGKVKSTDGLDIVRECKIKESDGEWIVGEVNEKQERITRINRIMQSESVTEKATKQVPNKPLSSEISLLENEKDSDSHSSDPLLETGDEDFDMVPRNSDIRMLENTRINATASIEEQDKKTIDIANVSGENQNMKRIKNAEMNIYERGQQSDVMYPENNLINIDCDKIINKMDDILRDAKRERRKLSSEGLVECGIWDFAGQKDYYATHQTFFTPDAIYLLVANINDAMEEINFNFLKNTKRNGDLQNNYPDTDYDSIGKYIDFWFDSIHCFCEDQTTNRLDPPIFVVFTGIDDVKEFTKMKAHFEDAFRRSFKSKKVDHMRGIFFISNIRMNKTDKKEIIRLKKNISEVAKDVDYFEKILSTEWIQLENAIGVLKDSNKDILSWQNVEELADRILIQERKNLLVFLSYQHKIGNIIFFEDIKECIILKPELLVKCFRCLVCDADKLDLKSIPVSESNKLKNTGELSDIAMKQLLKKEPDLACIEEYLPNIMEKFDIIVKPKLMNSSSKKCQKSDTYFIPCMITNKFQLKDFQDESFHRTPWLVLEFDFLPVAYFNHILFNYIRTYTVCNVASEDQAGYGHPAIDSGKAVVALDDTESKLLIICFSQNAISLQICSETKLINNDANDRTYKFILEKLCSNIEELERKLLHNLSYKIKAKCSTGEYFKSIGRISVKQLNTEHQEYRCTEHSAMHNKEDIENTWLKHAPAVEKKREFEQEERRNRIIEEKSSKQIKIPKIITENDIPGNQIRGSTTGKARYQFCAAIDIGSTYSGYAFSSYDEYRFPPTKIITNIWSGSKLLSLKTPTAVLLNSSQELIAFGYEAENKYSELVADEEHEDYYYFHNFKMDLISRRITRDMKIKDELYKKMEALKVFQYAIQFLKDHLFQKIYEMEHIQEDDVCYVLTVPAIWEDSGKQFMREAATKAGIRSRQLIIALEPDAAFIYCQHLKTDRWAIGNAELKKAFAQTLEAGMKYMVVDLGGGTADITVHQRYGDGSLKEVVPASGGPWGGKSIDEAFHAFLKRICGPKVMEELRKTELEDFIDLFREFETKKRSIRVDQTNKVVVTLPVALIDLVKSHRGKMETALEQSPYGQAVSYSKQKLHISPDTFRDFFKATTQGLIIHLKRMFLDDRLSDLENLIMVGGFSECKLIQHRMKEKFGKHKKIIIPEEAGLAVLKGAVLYGHQSKAISTLVLHRTYGIKSWPEWDPQMHPESKKVNLGGVIRCKDVFLKYAQVDQQVEPGHEVSQVIQVFESDKRTLECTVYVSTDPNPRFVTDISCQRLGSLIIRLPEIRAGQILEIEETMVFGDSELLFRAKNINTGRVVENQFDLL